MTLIGMGRNTLQVAVEPNWMNDFKYIVGTKVLRESAPSYVLWMLPDNKVWCPLVTSQDTMLRTILI